ncbi:MAG: ATP synthase F1 subunit delta [Patescibacteria group bacterium]|jgi:F-type H+-transporting ATPase subunit delta
MKKISAKKYGRVLYEATKDLTEKEAHSALANFVKILAANRHMKLAKKIIQEYNQYSNEQEGIVEAEVITARALSASLKEEITKKIKSSSKAETVLLTEKVDKKILGGMIIKIADTVIDGSILNSINNLKQSLTR